MFRSAVPAALAKGAGVRNSCPADLLSLAAASFSEPVGRTCLGRADLQDALQRFLHPLQCMLGLVGTLFRARGALPRDVEVLGQVVDTLLIGPFGLLDAAPEFGRQAVDALL